MKKITFLFMLMLGLFSQAIFAQVTKKVVVEHFTNSYCSFCSSRNPGLFQNLNNTPEVLHLAIFPSKPYRSCELNQHNTTENDSRAMYYDNIFGSTPRIVIQGAVQSSGVNFASTSLFTNYLKETSPVSISIETLKKDVDSLTAKIVLKIEAANSLGNLKLYVPAVEDTVFYDAPNGENEHYNVFRKVLFDGTLSLPSMVGDSLVYTVRTANHMDWDSDRMFVMAMLQEETSKAMVQAESSEGQKPTTTSASVPHLDESEFTLYPNPTPNKITLSFRNELNGILTLTNLVGDVVQTAVLDQHMVLDISHLKGGIYWLKIDTDKGSNLQKVIKL